MSIPVEKHGEVCKSAQSIWADLSGSVRDRHSRRIDSGVKKVPWAYTDLGSGPWV